MGSEKWSKNEKLTEDEVNNIVDFFYKDKGKELKKICNQILHIIWNDIPDYYRDGFDNEGIRWKTDRMQRKPDVIQK